LPGGTRTHWKTVPSHGARERNVTSSVDGVLQRLDAALADFIASGTVTDEVLPEIKRRRAAPQK
jgi:hypothetical protein